MTEIKLTQLCMITAVMVITQFVLTTSQSDCILQWLCPELQVLVAGEQVLYSTDIDMNWCIDGVPANDKENFTEVDKYQMYSYSPSLNDDVHGKLLYLTNKSHESSGCSKEWITELAGVAIQSNVSETTSTMILLHVVEALYCPQLPSPSNGQVIISTLDKSGKSVQIANFSCSPGYSLNGNDSLRCVREGNIGVWSSEERPTCEPIMCNNLTTISDGNVTYYKATNSKVISDNKQVPYGTIGNYSCNSGFKLTSGDNIRICQENQNNGTGVWSGTEPNCTEITYEKLEAPPNCSEVPYPGVDTNLKVTVINKFEDTGYKIGTVASHTCDQECSTSITSQCKENGQCDVRIEFIDIDAPNSTKLRQQSNNSMGPVFQMQDIVVAAVVPSVSLLFVFIVMVGFIWYLCHSKSKRLMSDKNGVVLVNSTNNSSNTTK